MQADGSEGSRGPKGRSQSSGSVGLTSGGLPKALQSLDAWEFCRLGKTLEGEVAAERLSLYFGRLAESLLNAREEKSAGKTAESPSCAPLKWRIEGFCDRDGRCSMRISGQFEARQECMRCGLPVHEHVEFNRRLHLCKSEQEADTLETGEDEDAVAAPGKVDVASWIEDETLLCLPMFPAHAQCDQVQATPVSQRVTGQKNEVPDETHRPFEQLASLLKNTTGNK